MDATQRPPAAQLIEWKMDVMSKEKESYNWKRTLRMGFFGTFIAGPLLAVWYRTLGLTSEALQAGDTDHRPQKLLTWAHPAGRVHTDCERLAHAAMGEDDGDAAGAAGHSASQLACGGGLSSRIFL